MSSPMDASLFDLPTPISEREVNAGYAALPESIRASYSEEQWLWFSDSEKAHLVQRECEPEVE
jgi:hypothetical protein